MRDFYFVVKGFCGFLAILVFGPATVWGILPTLRLAPAMPHTLSALTGFIVFLGLFFLVNAIDKPAPSKADKLWENARRNAATARRF